MKRSFYNTKVDPDFEKTVESKDKADMEDFNKYCHLFNHLGELGYADESSDYDRMTLLCRRLLHLVYLLLLPMNLPFAWALPLLSSLSYVLFKQPKLNK